jgi:hypothetical protein
MRRRRHGYTSVHATVIDDVFDLLGLRHERTKREAC